MAIGFPNTSNDFSVGSNATSFSLAPPANKADGDLFIAITSGRNSPISVQPGSGWTAIEITGFASNGAAGNIGPTDVYYMTVPTASSLPANWTWTNTETRWSVMILRITGVNLSNPITAFGTFTGTGADGQHISVGAVSSGGAALMAGTSYFNETANDPSSSTINGWNVLQHYGMTTAQAGRQACVTYGGLDNGSGSTTAFTLDITTTGQWNLSNEAVGQAAIIVLGLNAVATVTQPTLLKAGIV